MDFTNSYGILCRYGGIGRHKGLKIPRKKFRTGSTPVSGTKNPECGSIWDFYLFTFHSSLFTKSNCLGFLEVNN